MQLLDLLLLALATLYVAHVVTATDGPFYAFRWLRDNTRRALKGLFDCIWCTAFWVALLLMALYLWVPNGIYAVYVFAIAGAALAIRTYTGAHHG